MIALTEAEQAAFDAVGEARRLIAIANRENTQENWRRAHEAAFYAWAMLRDISKDTTTARADVLDLRAAMLRESSASLRQLEFMRERKGAL